MDERDRRVEQGGDGASGRYLRPALYLVLALSALAVGRGLFAFRDWVENSPRFCQTCHLVAPEIAIWTESQHRDVRCQQCHHQDLASGLRVLRVYLAGGAPDGETHAPVRVSSCGSCHASHDARWPSIANSVGHSVHSQRARLECTTCHGNQMHFDKPVRETCQGCHEGWTSGTAHEQQHCLACHDFLEVDGKITPKRSDCLVCHLRQERPVVVDPTAPMQFACQACHRPHVDAKITGCEECHEDRELPGLHTNPGHAACEACHRPHDWLSTRRDCYECHDDLYSHYPDRSCGECHAFEARLRTGP